MKWTYARCLIINWYFKATKICFSSQTPKERHRHTLARFPGNSPAGKVNNGMCISNHFPAWVCTFKPQRLMLKCLESFKDVLDSGGKNCINIILFQQQLETTSYRDRPPDCERPPVANSIQTTVATKPLSRYNQAKILDFQLMGFAIGWSVAVHPPFYIRIHIIPNQKYLSLCIFNIWIVPHTVIKTWRSSWASGSRHLIQYTAGFLLKIDPFHLSEFVEFKLL